MASWTRINTPELPEFPAFGHGGGRHDLRVRHDRVEGRLHGRRRGWDRAETTQAFRHVERILRACDGSLGDVVKVSAYLLDLGEWDAMNQANLEVFGERTPARMAVGCASLWFGGAVEFDCVAYRPG